jgi:hypothetical protein
MQWLNLLSYFWGGVFLAKAFRRRMIASVSRKTLWRTMQVLWRAVLVTAPSIYTSFPSRDIKSCPQFNRNIIYV